MKLFVDGEQIAAFYKTDQLDGVVYVFAELIDGTFTVVRADQVRVSLA